MRLFYIPSILDCTLSILDVCFNDGFVYFCCQLSNRLHRSFFVFSLVVCFYPYFLLLGLELVLECVVLGFEGDVVVLELLD